MKVVTWERRKRRRCWRKSLISRKFYEEYERREEVEKKEEEDTANLCANIEANREALHLWVVRLIMERPQRLMSIQLDL